MLPTPLVKEKNFGLEFDVINNATGDYSPDLHGIEMKLIVKSLSSKNDKSVYNKLGAPILKGNVTATIMDQKLVFNKVQFTDVTSHYREGELVLVVEQYINLNIKSSRRSLPIDSCLALSVMGDEPLLNQPNQNYGNKITNGLEDYKDIEKQIFNMNSLQSSAVFQDQNFLAKSALSNPFNTKLGASNVESKQSPLYNNEFNNSNNNNLFAPQPQGSPMNHFDRMDRYNNANQQIATNNKSPQNDKSNDPFFKFNRDPENPFKFEKEAYVPIQYNPIKAKNKKSGATYVTHTTNQNRQSLQVPKEPWAIQKRSSHSGYDNLSYGGVVKNILGEQSIFSGGFNYSMRDYGKKNADEEIVPESVKSFLNFGGIGGFDGNIGEYSIFDGNYSSMRDHTVKGGKSSYSRTKKGDNKTKNRERF